MRRRSIREGDILPSKLCGDFVIKEYVDSENIIIEFIQTGYKTSARLPHVVRGNVKDKMLPDLCGVGYIGDGYTKVVVNKGSLGRICSTDAITMIDLRILHIRTALYVMSGTISKPSENGMMRHTLLMVLNTN